MPGLAMPAMNSIRRWGRWLIASSLVACGDQPVAPSSRVPSGPSAHPIVLQRHVDRIDAALIVSDPAVAAAPGAGPAGGAEQQAHVFVSLPSGTVPSATSAVLVNARSQEEQFALMTEGGMDPVAIKGREGDTLIINIARETGSDTVLAGVVPPRRRPVIVRSLPPRGKTDVPLNARVVVVFSEPVDRTSVTASTVRLEGPNQVNSALELDPTGTRLEITPLAELQGSSTYHVTVTSGLVDFDGDAIEQPTPIEFTTVYEPLKPGSPVLILDLGTTLAPGETSRLRADAYDAEGQSVPDAPVSWSVADPEIATIEAGVIRALKVGTTSYTATSGSATATATLEVSELRFTVVDPGFDHSCGLTDTGVAYCWGEGYVGVLGTGTTGESSTPVRVAGGITFDTISVGGAACGLTGEGRAYCWGGSLAVPDDELQNCSTFLIPRPLRCNPKPVLVSGNLRFVSISVGNEHACGITKDGDAYCWGENAAGQLGDASTSASVAPVRVIGGIRFRSISAGAGGIGMAVTCGVAVDGAAYCWGASGRGQLGNGSDKGPELCSFPAASPPWRDCSTVPVKVKVNIPFVSISVGTYHVCALTNSGVMFCWGWTQPGGSALTPQSVLGFLRFLNVDLYASEVRYAETCGVEVGSDEVLCSDGPGMDFKPAYLRARSVKIGNFHRCAIALDGVAYCWGINDVGQLGAGHRTSTDEPTRVAGQSKKGPQ